MAPSFWNSLQADLRNLSTLSQFKSNLKTFLFAQAFLQFIVLLTTGYASIFVLFVCLFLNMERCMWKGRMGETGEGTVNGREKVRRRKGGWERDFERGRGGEKK